MEKLKKTQSDEPAFSTSLFGLVVLERSFNPPDFFVFFHFPSLNRMGFHLLSRDHRGPSQWHNFLK